MAKCTSIHDDFFDEEVEVPEQVETPDDIDADDGVVIDIPENSIQSIDSNLPGVAIGPVGDDLHIYPQNDLGNGEVYAKVYGHRFRYCEDIKKWLYFDKKRWIQSELMPELFLRKALKKYEHRIRANNDGKIDGKLWKHLNGSVNDAKTNSAVRAARSLWAFKSKLTTFDINPYLLNCQNGTLDVSTGEFKDFNLQDKLTKMSPIAYDKDATCPQWEATLLKYMLDDQVLVDYIQEILGMCLTGDRSERFFAIWEGIGQNGKNIILDALLAILGHDYSWSATPGFLEKKKTPDLSTMMELKGKRFVLLSESNKKMEMDVDFVKAMTGNVEITGCAKYQQPCTFEVTHKSILITNHAPDIKDTSSSIWDRVHKLMWEYRVTEQEKNTRFQQEVIAPEYPGILNWLVEGCIRWKNRGHLIKPDKVIMNTEEYREDSNSLSDFFETTCDIEITDPNERAEALQDKDKKYSVDRKHLYQAYCLQAGTYKLKNKNFYKEIRDMAFAEKKTTLEGKSVRLFTGIKLKVNKNFEPDKYDDEINHSDDIVKDDKSNMSQSDVENILGD